jgi:DNA-directed RNA polymerase subunit beta'
MKSIFSQKEESTKNKYSEITSLIKDLEEKSTLSEDDLAKLYGFDTSFMTVEMGAEAVKKVLEKINLEDELKKLEEEKETTKSALKKRKIIQRLRVIEGMYRAGIDSTWLIVSMLPVIPPDLRPIIQLPGGRFATSDLNDLYRRVINRNNRLKRLIDLGAPEIILRNEKRMLQESVDALVDNDHRPGNAVLNSRGQPYKSLSDMLRGKQGRFRQNLLGKRVDYSGRSVIIPGPDLKISQCGLPKTMALELFKPFVLREIIADGLAPNIKSAKHFFESKSTEVWDILERVIQNRPVLLNRAPTLHKQGIQAFFPVLTEGDAIRLHPMVCKGFNADFDGDQMAVHVPLSKKAIDEAIEKMFAESNLLLSADGQPVVNVEKDMALGIYYLTGVNDNKEVKYFASENEAVGIYENGQLHLRDKIKVLIGNEIIETTVGRLLLNDILPEGYGYVNQQLNKKDVAKISATVLEKYGRKTATQVLDSIEGLGFKYATKSGVSVGTDELVIDDQKDVLLNEVEDKDNQLNNDYNLGLLTLPEKRRLSEQMWMDLVEKVAEITWNKYAEDPNNNLVILQESGALPVQNPLRQISGIRGLILDPLGNIVELPLRSNYKQGLSNLEYFVAARGTRKGLADTALRTAESGYLTRRLVDVAQDVIIKEEDCGTQNSFTIVRENTRRLGFDERITGRFAGENIADPKTGEIIAKKDEEITQKKAELIEKTDLKEVQVRSVLTCETKHGVCQKCYGYDLGTRKVVNLGIAVGIIAAQSMGEAATQLTLNTKHLAGRAGTDITQGLPRVEELFEVRTPKRKAVLAEIDGKVEFIFKDKTEKVDKIRVSNRKQMQKVYELEEGDTTEMKRTKKFKEGEVIYVKKNGEKVTAEMEGKATKDADKIIFIIDKEFVVEYEVDEDAIINVEDGDNVIKGTPLTSGSQDPKEIMKIDDIKQAQQYLIDNVQETYGIQGIGIDDKHVEVVVRQVSRFSRVTDAGDSEYLPGDYADHIELRQLNEQLKTEGKRTVKSKRQLLGITFAAIKTDSFLSAASFEQQVRVLSEAGLIGKVDYLRGLKENVIIGRTVPLGDEVR